MDAAPCVNYFSFYTLEFCNTKSPNRYSILFTLRIKTDRDLYRLRISSFVIYSHSVVLISALHNADNAS
jgi:hypothetical protein